MKTRTAIHGLTFHSSRFGRGVAERGNQMGRVSVADHRVALTLGKSPA